MEEGNYDPKPVLIFIEYKYYDGRGNWDRELMKRLSKRGYPIHTITCPFSNEYKDEEDELKSLGVIFHFSRFNKYYFIMFCLIELVKVLNEHGNFVLYTPSIRLIPFLYIITSISKVNIIFSLQGGPIRELDFMPESEHFRKNRFIYKLKRSLIKNQLRISAIFARKIIVISEAIKEELAQIKIPSDKVELIYYAVDTNLFLRDLKKREIIRRQYNIDNSSIVITYIARLSKNVPTKLWSAERLLELVAEINSRDVRILFVGGGDGVGYLKDLCQKYGLNDLAIFAGFKPYQEIPAFLSASDIFWFVMRDPLPTYGIALLEAMSCENIVITNNSGSMKEIINDRINGFLANPDTSMAGDILKELLESEMDLERIKLKSREEIEERFSWDTTVLRIEKIIKEAK